MKKIYKKKYKSEKKKKNIIIYITIFFCIIFIHIQIIYLINSKYMLLYTCDRNNEKINKERK
ncbi:hypothetical protein PFMC_04188 [Plasmodium falciparum CAMP/Malaysia]|uniref:Uncharacterized protein n=1 Tax=Plasmodium falciparum (isolate Camp / Malaysia) TaxID=5835 RepID=A0A024X3A2_PLAFC|nr:hypothetical protein PFMC_04188 [Plasmodium falciparum CAMP/Malaysia]